MNSPTTSSFWSSKRRIETLRKSVALTVIALLSVTMIVPVAWMIAISLKEPQNVFQMPPFKVDWHWINYLEAWYPQGQPTYGDNFMENVRLFFLEKESFWLYLFNTLVITAMSTFGACLSAAIVAFGFARLRFPGRNGLFLLVVSTIMVPHQVIMIPTFMLFSSLGWRDTYLPLIVPAFLGGGAYNIFLLRQFFMTIPYELDEAAKIDGCSSFGTFWRILLPLSIPALVTVVIFGVVYNWNDFLNPLIYISDSRKFTLVLGLNQFRSLYGSSTNLMMAASTLVLLPILLLFFFGQKYFIQGIATTGLKG